MVSLESAFVEQTDCGILRLAGTGALLQHLHDGFASIFDCAAIIDCRDIEIPGDSQRAAFQPAQDIVPAFPSALFQPPRQHIWPCNDVHDLQTGKGRAEMRRAERDPLAMTTSPASRWR